MSLIIKDLDYELNNKNTEEINNILYYNFYNYFKENNILDDKINIIIIDNPKVNLYFDTIDIHYTSCLDYIILSNFNNNKFILKGIDHKKIIINNYNEETLHYKYLDIIEIKNCKKLKKLELTDNNLCNIYNCESLNHLELIDCEKINILNCNNLSKLILKNCNIIDISNCNNINELIIKDCNYINNINDLKHLQKLEINYNFNIFNLINDLNELEELKISDSKIKELQKNNKIKKLELSNCNNINFINNDFDNLETLILNKCENLYYIDKLKNLKELIINDCYKLHTIPIFDNLHYLKISYTNKPKNLKYIIDYDIRDTISFYNPIELKNKNKIKKYLSKNLYKICIFNNKYHKNNDDNNFIKDLIEYLNKIYFNIN